jgi:hypothetical protein
MFYGQKCDLFHIFEGNMLTVSPKISGIKIAVISHRTLDNMCGVSRYLKGEDMMKLRKLGALATACGLFALFAIGNAHADNWYHLFDLSGLSTVLGNGNELYLVWVKPFIDVIITGFANVLSNCYAFCFKTPVSEPNTFAMMVASLGFMRYIAWHRKW